jgi:hypothetical protein
MGEVVLVKGLDGVVVIDNVLRLPFLRVFLEPGTEGRGGWGAVLSEVRVKQQQSTKAPSDSEGKEQ